MGLKEHEHTPEAIRERLEEGPRLSYLRDFVYGGIDGAVTTFAVVSGVVGAELAPAVILILGAANLVGDGFSMAASNYSGTKSEREELERMREIEYRHIQTDPEGEREEIRQIFARKGYKDADLERAVELVTSNADHWVETMLGEEYGLATEVRSPLKAAMMTMVAFLVCGLVPLTPFLFQFPQPFLVSALFTGAVFFTIGSVKSRWSLVPWWKSGVETLTIGSVAAALAYGVGYLLRGVAGS